MFLKSFFIFILTIFFLITKISNAQQVISSNTSSPVTALGGDFTVNAGVTINYSSKIIPTVTVNNVNVENFINNGTITTGINDGSILNFTSTSTSSSITNNGTMFGKTGLNLNSRTAIINNNSGSTAIWATDRALLFNSGSSGSSVNNTTGTIRGDYAAIRNASGVTLSNITNASGATIQGIFSIENYGTVTNLTNNGKHSLGPAPLDKGGRSGA